MLVGGMSDSVQSWQRAMRCQSGCIPSLKLQGECVDGQEGRGWNSRYNDIVGHVAKVQSRLGVFGSRSGDDLPQQGGHVL